MKPLFLVISFLASAFLATAQKREAQLEIKPYLQWDHYPAFTTPFNSVMNSSIKMNGAGWGISASYYYPIKRNVAIQFGLGYFKYSFNEIKQYNTLFGRSDNRRISYPGGSSTFAYVSDKYWYNTATVHIGIEKLFSLQENTDVVIGFDMVNYYSFSQRYSIPGRNIIYKTSNNRYFGAAFMGNAGLLKTFGKMSVGPMINMPVFGFWKQDEIFPGEQNNKARSKWLKGVGIGITARYRFRRAI